MKTILYKIFKVAPISIVTLIVIILIAGYVFFSPSHDEVVRVTSPNGKLDAVLYESNGGATTSYWYDVYIVKKGEGIFLSNSIVNLYGAIRNENAYGVNLEWINDHALVAKYLRAKKMTLNREEIEVAGELIKLELQEGIIDQSAPSGGMLYNIEKKHTTSGQ